MEDGMKTRVMAMHQPNYLPYLGYFYKMARCDVFVYLDVVQYPRGRSFAPRNRIKTPQGPAYLTVPTRIPKGRDGKVRYVDVELAGSDWKRKHMKTLRMSYSRAPFVDPVAEIYERELLAGETFIQMNINLIEAFADYLAISTRRMRLSQILDKFGEKTGLIRDICTALGSETYLSGTGGGRDYNDVKMLAEHGIELAYSDFQHPRYPQRHGEFVSHLSILDVLCNVGPDTRELL